MPFYDSMIFLTQIQVLAHGLVEIHEFNVGPLLNFADLISNLSMSHGLYVVVYFSSFDV